MLIMTKSLLLLVLYVDDLLIIVCSTATIFSFKRIMHDRFLMIDIGPLHFFLGLEISQDASNIKLSQAKYAQDLLERFHMTGCKSALTPFLLGFILENGRDTPLVEKTLYIYLVGSFLYLKHSRPYLSYAIGAVSSFMQDLHEIHWKDEKNILRYVWGTITFGIHYSTDSTLYFIRFIDFDWAGDNIYRKSTSGYSFSLVFRPSCWSSKKHVAISLSSTKVEYKGVFNITIHAMWLHHFLTELGVQFHRSIIIWCDNQRTLKFCRDPIQRQWTKHIKIHMHYI
jgi:hypothetical protein